MKRMRHLALALLLAGCGATGGTPTGPKREPIATTPAHEAIPSADTNLGPGCFIGPVRLGMSRTEVRAAVGVEPEVDEDTPEFDQFPTRGLEVQFDDKGVASAIHAYSAERAGYETRTRTAFPLQGPDGMHWGMTAEQVIAVMGSKGKTGDLSGAPVPTNWMSYSNIMFDFVTSTGHLFHVVVYPAEAEAESN